MKAFLNSFMSRLGYVPDPSKLATSISTIKIDVDIDSASVDAAIVKLDQMATTARAAEAAIGALDAGLLPIVKQFAADFGADPERDKLFCEMRALVWEIRQERAESRAAMRKVLNDLDGGPATGASASGLPG